MKTMKIWRIAFMMLAAFSLASCGSDDDDKEIVEQVTIFVSAETGTYNVVPSNTFADKYVYSYVSKPFELTMSLEKDTFIPLVCYCSFWYDAEDKVTRCWGENFIKPDLSSDILKNVPHYYVLGIKFY